MGIGYGSRSAEGQEGASLNRICNANGSIAWPWIPGFEVVEGSRDFVGLDQGVGPV